MINTRAIEIAEKLNQSGVPPKFGPEVSKLLIKVMRKVADGQPITSEYADTVVNDIGMDIEEATQFLRNVTERDDKDNITGIVGLSQNPDWAHDFQVRGNSLKTWCAWDTLFIPLLLNEEAKVESKSPASDEVIRVTVNPEGVMDTSPEGAVVSVVVLDPDKGEVETVEEAWAQFCHQVYFFASREEAMQWSADRDDVEILSVDDAFDLGRIAWSSVLEYV